MSRYIDADKFKEFMDMTCDAGGLMYPVVREIKEYVKKQIDGQPTADVVEVCLCKDCKYRKFIDWGMGDCLHPKGSKHIAYDYHYCSYGERKENEQIH